jgi:hypothetical protein
MTASPGVSVGHIKSVAGALAAGGSVRSGRSENSKTGPATHVPRSTASVRQTRGRRRGDAGCCARFLAVDTSNVADVLDERGPPHQGLHQGLHQGRHQGRHPDIHPLSGERSPGGRTRSPWRRPPTPAPAIPPRCAAAARSAPTRCRCGPVAAKETATSELTATEAQLRTALSEGRTLAERLQMVGHVQRGRCYWWRNHSSATARPSGTKSVSGSRSCGVSSASSIQPPETISSGWCTTGPSQLVS